MANSTRTDIATNRRARRDYEVMDTFEAGIQLRGPEVKALRERKANLGDAYAVIRRGEVFLQHLHIGAYGPARHANSDPLRERKLLLHRAEIQRLTARVHERGFTLVPLSLYFKDGIAKVELALARGRARYDKRQVIRQREDRREAERGMRRGNRER